MKILFATNNLHKIEEAKKIINEIDKEDKIQLVSLKDLPTLTTTEPLENGKTFFDNALIKARFYYELYKIPVISDDSGLVVDELNGEPGIYSARYAKGENYGGLDIHHNNRLKLLEKLENITNRQAHFHCTTVFYNGEKIITGKGNSFGEITTKEKGDGGFGYDSIFFNKEFGKTYAELPSELKNQISHRYLSLVDLFQRLKEEKVI